MKIAAISDIHSNVFALEAVIEDLRKRGADIIVNLGDIFYGPIAPRATYQLLQQHEILSIRGNQDLQICKVANENTDSKPITQFVIDDLGSEPLVWIEGLPFDQQLDEHVYLCHGTPSNDCDYLLENVFSGIPVLKYDHEILVELNNINSSLILCGHSHVPRTVSLSSGQLVANPGSVGLPAYTDEKPVKHSMENYSHHASYMIIERSLGGWLTQHIKVPYAFEKAVESAKENNRINWAHYLSTGRGI